MGRIPAAGAHGGDGARVAAALGIAPEDVLDLSMSLNPFAPDVAAMAGRHLGALGRYPDVGAAERVAAEMVGAPPERFVLTAGGAQAIALVAEHLGAGWVDEPDFSLYARHLHRLDPTAPRWRSDPHNPTGLLADFHSGTDLPDEPHDPTGLLADFHSGTDLPDDPHDPTGLLADPHSRADPPAAADSRTDLLADRHGAGHRAGRQSPAGSADRGSTGVVADPQSPAGSGGRGGTGVGNGPQRSGGAGDADHGRRAAAGGDRGSGVGVWDEAFLPLSAGCWTRARPGWALGSLTKAFACPGLRLGYAIAPSDDEAGAVRRRRPAWAVGGLACAVLPELAAAADPAGWTKQIVDARAATVDVLRRHGLAPRPSDAPWLLVPHADGLREALARQAVVVRDCSSFGLPDHVRIAVPDDAGLDRLDAALAKAAATRRRSDDQSGR